MIRTMAIEGEGIKNNHICRSEDLKYKSSRAVATIETQLEETSHEEVECQPITYYNEFQEFIEMK